MTSLKIVDVRSGLYRLPILSSPTSMIPVGYESLPAFLIQHPCDTFVIQANRGFEIYSRIHPDDLLVVDRATEPLDGDIAVVVVDGEFVIKRVELHGDRLAVVPEDNRDRPSSTHPEVALEVWGVIINFIHNLRKT